MVMYIENPQESIKQLLELVSEFSRNSTNMSILFSYTCKEKLENEKVLKYYLQ